LEEGAEGKCDGGSDKVKDKALSDSVVKEGGEERG
jgi:hypothetical protein